ncbi:MAG: hypothetical protein K6F21_02510 [Bacteroidales bacterium]|nr:hypothetical protein [Bacteroidales bacterium]
MNGFRRICAALMGIVLLVAGLLKLMDPVGAGLVMDEYLNFFHLGFLKGISRILASALALAESLVGAALIAGVWRRIVAMVSGIMLFLFTVLTLVLYIAKPAMDCGCFGEIVHLSHAQTLLKNLILDALWCLAFIPMKNLGEPQRIKYVSFGLSALSLVLFLLFSSLSIPLRDYTDFKPGTELEEQPLFFYDANYVYADSLLMEGSTMVVSVYDVAKFKSFDRVADFARNASAEGFNVILLMTATPDDVPALGVNPALLSGTYFADRKALLTLNRSNGGVTYIEDGQIIRKWAFRGLPGAEDYEAIKEKAPMDYLISRQNRTRALFQGFTLYLSAILFLL